MTTPQNDHEFSRQEFNDANRRHPKDLIYWLEEQSNLAHLKDIALSPDAPLKLPQHPRWRRALVFLKRVVWTNHSALYGTSHVTPELIAESKSIARAVSGANLINCMTTFPLILRTFLGLGGAGIPLSIIMVALINNYCGALAESTCRSRIKPGAWASLAGFFLVNLLLSLTAPPGTELMLNQKELATLKSKELIGEKVLDFSLQEKRLTELKEVAQETREGCALKEEEISSLDKNDPNRNLLILKTFGSYNASTKRFEYDKSSFIPVCPNADLKEQAAEDYERKMYEEQAAKEEAIRSYGSETIYLREEQPYIYEEHFDSNGHIRAGLEASRIAIQNFGARLTNGSLAALGFPFIFFALSLVTSGVAVVKIGLYSRRDDVLLSWDQEAYQLREEMYCQVIQGLHDHHSAQDNIQQNFSSNGKITTKNGFIKHDSSQLH